MRAPIPHQNTSRRASPDRAHASSSSAVVAAGGLEYQSLVQPSKGRVRAGVGAYFRCLPIITQQRRSALAVGVRELFQASQVAVNSIFSHGCPKLPGQGSHDNRPSNVLHNPLGSLPLPSCQVSI